MEKWPDILIAVVGKGRNCPPPVYQLAHEVGGTVARLPDCLLVTGGLGGAMEAAARGAKENGGRVLSLLPGVSNRTTQPHTEVDIRLDTGLTANGRNIVLASVVNAMIAVPGSHGALQEMIVAVDAGKTVWAVGEHTTRLPGVEYLASSGELSARLHAFTAASTSDLG
ncbi:LOG family protein [Streptomyces pathocidini]|uniref:8-AzgD n=1 Tax=Streptomyces pathocidini TaxID=1650571 RepID=A0A6G9KJ81_9ACTN|nr:LOG family protein [Streptomyces pathocidini]QIQ51170.1 PtnC [Streptomyces pathocidini]QLM04718.1 8-AzgD [Streptomyces pathocidini]